MIRAKFSKDGSWQEFRSLGEAVDYGESIGAAVIRFAHDPVPLVRIDGDYCWLDTSGLVSDEARARRKARCEDGTAV